MTALDVYIRDCYGCRHVTRLGRMMASDMASLITIIHSIHGVEWDRLWTSYNVNYNPVWNVDGDETTKVTRSTTSMHSGTDKYVDGGSDSVTHSGTDTYKDSGSDSSHKTSNDESNVTTSVNGFDGGEVNDSAVNTTANSEETDSTIYGKTNTNTKDLTDSTLYGKTNTNTKDLKDTETETVTTENKRGGNIGVTMTQQMLEADLSYWTKAKAQFYRNVIREIVDEITYSIVVDCDDSEMSASTQTLIITALLNDGVPIAEVDTQANTVSTLIKNGVPVAESEVKNG